jgi:hypothetical protein
MAPQPEEGDLPPSKRRRRPAAGSVEQVYLKLHPTDRVWSLALALPKGVCFDWYILQRWRDFRAVYEDAEFVYWTFAPPYWRRICRDDILSVQECQLAYLRHSQSRLGVFRTVVVTSAQSMHLRQAPYAQQLELFGK